ncbi:MAG TPA: hypothetical protein VI172_12585 [Candidatus Dormibacteraeota bacterium]
MDFNEFIRSQFPLRPDTPDWDRLREVVEIVEDLKARGVPAKEAYADIVDVVTASYMGANRMGMNLPRWVHDLPQDRAVEILELMTNAWVEGLFFGVQFERRGGHRTGPDDATDPT